MRLFQEQKALVRKRRKWIHGEGRTGQEGKCGLERGAVGAFPGRRALSENGKNGAAEEETIMQTMRSRCKSALVKVQTEAIVQTMRSR
jgi:hypothetical protein